MKNGSVCKDLILKDEEKEITKNHCGFIFFCPITNFLKFLKVEIKFDPLIIL
jgi:hypothetical protein